MDFVDNLLQNLSKSKDIRKRSFSELKKVVIETADLINGNKVDCGFFKSATNPSMIYSCFAPFIIATQSQSASVVVISLDCLHQLLVHELISEYLTDPTDPRYILVEKIIFILFELTFKFNKSSHIQITITKICLTIASLYDSSVKPESMMFLVRSLINIFVLAENSEVMTTANAALNQILGIIFTKIGNNSHNDPHIEQLVSQIIENSMDHDMYKIKVPELERILSSLNVRSAECSDPNWATYSDCFCEYRYAHPIFSNLCKIVADDSQPIDDKYKQISLNSIYSLIKKFPQVFSSSEKLMSIIKNLLCLGILKNSFSHSQLGDLSISIFFELWKNLRDKMKEQLEVIFNEIIFYILESSCSNNLKWRIMCGLSTFCQEPQFIFDMYVNYDCHMNSHNLFEKLVVNIASMTQKTDLPNKFIASSLNCLVSILNCLGDDVHLNKSVNSPAFINEGNAADSDSNAQKSISDESYANSLMRQKECKSVLERGIEIFNNSPLKGVLYFINNSFVAEEPKEIAKFILTNDRLNPNSVGDLLGDNSNLCLSIMHAYVESIDFSNMSFLPALRKFLALFRLPGEAQKIDRLMEKFASVYVGHNPNDFADADTVYVLSFAVIMLTTDLHSEQIREDRRMKKSDFITNLSHTSISQLSPEFLSDIYDEIAQYPIKSLKMMSKNAKLENERVKYSFNSIEQECVVNLAGVLLENASQRKCSQFYIVSHNVHIQPMFEILWTCLIATFGTCLYSIEDLEIIELCLNGLSKSVGIACLLNMQLERDAFLQSLISFTMLKTTSIPSLMKHKNIMAIYTLFSIAKQYGNFIDNSWIEILRCISQLERIQLLANNRKVINEANSQSLLISVDQLYIQSVNLDGNAIVYFIDALCKVSLEELSDKNSPGIFSLHKIVDVTYYNMDRIRILWSKIWGIVGNHFNQVGTCFSEKAVSIAVDAIKRMAMNFFDKGELSNFHFHKDFLRPYEYIMEKTTSEAVSNMIIDCTMSMIFLKAGVIKSGWKSIFNIFSIVATSHREIYHKTFAGLESIIDRIYPENPQVILDSFQYAVKCLSEFATNESDYHICMEAIDMMRKSAALVQKHSSLFGERVWVMGWFPVLFAVSRVMSHSQLEVRTRGLLVMFEIIKTYYDQFQPHWWMDFLNLIFRVVNNINMVKDPSQSICNTSKHILHNIVSVYSPENTEQFEYILRQLHHCLSHKNLSVIIVNCFEYFIIRNAAKFTAEHWRILCQFIEELSNIDFIQMNLLHALDSIMFGTVSPHGVDNSLIEKIERKVYINDLSADDKESILKVVLKCYNNCHTLLQNDVDVMVERETLSILLYLRCLFNSFFTDESNQPHYFSMIKIHSISCLEYFLTFIEEPKRRIPWEDVVAFIIYNIRQTPPEFVRDWIVSTYDAVCSLVAFQIEAPLRLEISYILKCRQDF